MTRKITFAELSRLLEGMDFERITQPTHVLFEHAACDAKVVLRPYQPREVVNETDLAVVRKTLDERGLMAAESFEHFMRKNPPDSREERGHSTQEARWRFCN
jgi:hypothetical protein